MVPVCSNRRVRRRFVIAATALTALAMVGALGHALRLDHDRRHGPDRVETNVEIRFAENENFGVTLTGLGGHASNRLGVPKGMRALLVRLQWRNAVSLKGSYALIGLDKAYYPPRPLAANGTWTPEGITGSHWSSSYVALAQRYDWLAGLGSVQSPDGKSFARPALGWPATDSGLAIGTWLIDLSDSESNVTPDLLVALVFVDPSGEPRWAKRVHD